MSGLSSWFGFGSVQGVPSTNEMPNLWPLPIAQLDFVRIDVINIYTKILTDVAERSQGLTEDHLRALWDNCLASEANDGLITRLAKAMYDKSEMFLVYDKATKILRNATNEEQAQIKADYAKQAESKAGTYISFKNYSRTDMVKLYSALEFLAIGALNKNMNVAKTVQIKISDLRASTAMINSDDSKAQAAAMSAGLALGRDLLMDAKDILENAKPDLTATEQAMNLFNQKRSFYIGMPASYITGELNAGLGDSGQADGKAIERGLKNFFFAIIKPTCKSLFGVELTFKSDDFQQLSTTLEALKTFELTGGELLSQDNKRVIVNKLLGLPEETKGDAPEKVVTPPAVPAAGPIPAKA